MVVFLHVLGEDVMGAFLRARETAYLLFPPHVGNKIWQGCRYRCERCCCKRSYDIIVFSRRTRVSNTGEKVIFLCVLGVGVMGAFLKVCEAEYLRFPPRVNNKCWQGCPYGCKRYCYKSVFNIINFSRRTRE